MNYSYSFLRFWPFGLPRLFEAARQQTWRCPQLQRSPARPGFVLRAPHSRGVGAMGSRPAQSSPSHGGGLGCCALANPCAAQDPAVLWQPGPLPGPARDFLPEISDSWPASCRKIFGQLADQGVRKSSDFFVRNFLIFLSENFRTDFSEIF